MWSTKEVNWARFMSWSTVEIEIVSAARSCLWQLLSAWLHYITNYIPEAKPVLQWDYNVHNLWSWIFSLWLVWVNWMYIIRTDVCGQYQHVTCCTLTKISSSSVQVRNLVTSNNFVANCQMESEVTIVMYTSPHTAMLWTRLVHVFKADLLMCILLAVLHSLYF